jgi:hypothetical protein
MTTMEARALDKASWVIRKLLFVEVVRGMGLTLLLIEVFGAADKDAIKVG